MTSVALLLQTDTEDSTATDLACCWKAKKETEKPKGKKCKYIVTESFAIIFFPLLYVDVVGALHKFLALSAPDFEQ